ncbi:MAG: hypothetical protein HXX08_00240 [Chloroflexi bacterium]|uniref:ATP-binding protein n=1 Tax=Candidatus Chlorohelix allophototropha TaxID=3003348 RepID=A0A8T7LVT5_9CHLR|nr:hypothetical protein [Chloroflexota bacterium]WJW66177.1 ATP-binding protein [Chloroflexota bacterium L227-S17]
MEKFGSAQAKRPATGQPVIIIVSGPPASGKTNLALKIAEHFTLPYFNKDSIKEILFDKLGWSDIAWSRKLNLASMEILYQIAGAQLVAKCNHILECNFKPEFDTSRFLDLQKQYDCKYIQIQCIADGVVLLERFRQRAQAGIRHPGHVDHEIESYLEPLLLRGRQGNLEIGGSLLEVDTTDFSKINYQALFDFISSQLAIA